MIELVSLTKKFGDFTAVDNLNLSIKTGEFFGLLGSNGAGKTTTRLCRKILPKYWRNEYFCSINYNCCNFLQR